MAYVEEFDLFNDQTNDLHKKVARAVVKASTDVIAEDPQTAFHQGRLQWAQNIRDNPDSALTQAHQVMLRVLENSTVSAAGNTAADNDVQFVVNGLVNVMAQVG